MRVVQVLSAVIHIGGLQGAAFLLVIDGLDIDQLALAEVKIDARAQEFFGQHRYVEARRIESGDVAALQKGGQRLGNLAECRFVPDVLVADAVDGLRFFGNGHLGIDAACFDFDLIVFAGDGRDLDNRNLYDAVVRNVQSRAFDIEKHERVLQIELHG